MQATSLLLTRNPIGCQMVDNGFNAQFQVRILHHMARSGGTAISKRLASMSGIVLLSEIHPLGTKIFNPLAQAHEWHRLLTPSDLRQLRDNSAIVFQDSIALIAQRCREQQKTLIIRDWSHLDFTAIPFLSVPTYELTLANMLAERLEVIHTATVRHPIDQWLSLYVHLQQDQNMQGKNLTLDRFLLGYLKFAEESVRIGFMRYEDFVRSPDAKLKILCARLAISFDARYKDRWYTYSKISGNTIGNRGGEEIAPLPRRKVEPNLLNEFARNADYQNAIKLLGYEHPQ